MIRLLLVTKLFEPVIGGVETVVGQIASKLAVSGDYRITILAGNEIPFSGTIIYPWNNVKVIKSGSIGIKYNTALSLQYVFLLKKLVKENDVIHFHCPNPLGELSFFFTPIPAYKKVVVTVYADITQTRRKNYGPVYNFFLRRLLERANIITTMTPNNLDRFPILQQYRTKCRIVPLAFDENHIRVVSPEEKIAYYKKYNLDKSLPVILFVGRLSADKGVNYLIKSMQEVKPGAQLIIAGDGYLKDSLTRQASDLNGKKIVFLGRASNDEIACSFSIATLFVLPSVTETFGIVQAEAMRFGLPVINTALNTGVNFVSIDQETGITVPPAEPLALAEAINKLIGDETMRRRLGQNALERSNLFTPEKMVSLFKEIYS